jgi:hypothetical protein
VARTRWNSAAHDPTASTKLSIGSSRLSASILFTLTGSTGTWAGRSGKRTSAGLR